MTMMFVEQPLALSGSAKYFIAHISLYTVHTDFHCMGPSLQHQMTKRSLPLEMKWASLSYGALIFLIIFPVNCQVHLKHEKILDLIPFI